MPNGWLYQKRQVPTQSGCRPPGTMPDSAVRLGHGTDRGVAGPVSVSSWKTSPHAQLSRGGFLNAAILSQVHGSHQDGTRQNP